MKYVRIEHTAPKTAHVDNLRAVWLGVVVLRQFVGLRLLGVFVTGQTETHQCETQGADQIIGCNGACLVPDALSHNRAVERGDCQAAIRCNGLDMIKRRARRVTSPGRGDEHQYDFRCQSQPMFESDVSKLLLAIERGYRLWQHPSPSAGRPRPPTLSLVWWSCWP